MLNTCTRFKSNKFIIFASMVKSLKMACRENRLDVFVKCQPQNVELS